MYRSQMMFAALQGSRTDFCLKCVYVFELFKLMCLQDENYKQWPLSKMLKPNSVTYYFSKNFEPNDYLLM